MQSKVGVYGGTEDFKILKRIAVPDVFSAPIRVDIVKDVFSDMRLNNRQPYAVSKKAGHQTSAESWGTGRAVARIPRVRGGGTHRSGQGAFGNMCRGGRMFAPTKTWRRWHRKINVDQKRYAVCSALAATAYTPLVMARGHRVETVPELPLVVEDEAIMHTTTQSAIKFLTSAGAKPELEKVKSYHNLRAGKGKMRGRRYRSKVGPLIISHTKCSKGFYNIPGVDHCDVNSLNLLKLAPGGHVGRFCIFTRSAVEALPTIYGSSTQSGKHNYKFPHPIMNKGLKDCFRTLVEKGVLRDPKVVKKHAPRANPLKNKKRMLELNPYILEQRKGRLSKRKTKAEIKAASRNNRAVRAFLMKKAPAAAAPEEAAEE